MSDLESFDDDEDEDQVGLEASEAESDVEPEEPGDDTSDDSEEDVQHFSKPAASVTANDAEKSEAVRMQLGLWDGLLETRIKLQKPLTVCNSLPQKETFADFARVLSKSEKVELEEVRQDLRSLLKDLVELQDDLLISNPQAVKSSNGIDDDEEIPSDDENEEESSKPLVERISEKLDGADFTSVEKLLSSRHESMLHFRNSTLETWAGKTRQFSVGNKKGFAAFEQPVLQQIDQIMADKNRLIQRTQVPRSVYRILGTSEENPKNESTSNPEIFDDDDFYHQLLKELIERKTGDTTDPIELSRQQIQLQQLRRKTRKIFDNKSSRDRKIKMDPIPKLINFMASHPVCQITEQARSDLFKSLFGKMFSEPEGESDGKLNEGLGAIRLVS